MAKYWTTAAIHRRICRAFEVRRDWMAEWEIRASSGLCHVPREQTAKVIGDMFQSGELIRAVQVDVADRGTIFESSMTYPLFLLSRVQSRITPYTLCHGVTPGGSA